MPLQKGEVMSQKSNRRGRRGVKRQRKIEALQREDRQRRRRGYSLRDMSNASLVYKRRLEQGDPRDGPPQFQPFLDEQLEKKRTK